MLHFKNFHLAELRCGPGRAPFLIWAAESLAPHPRTPDASPHPPSAVCCRFRSSSHHCCVHSHRHSIRICVLIISLSQTCIPLSPVDRVGPINILIDSVPQSLPRAGNLVTQRLTARHCPTNKTATATRCPGSRRLTPYASLRHRKSEGFASSMERATIMATHKTSFIAIDEYRLPKAGTRVAMVVCAALMTLSARRKFIEPKSILHDQVLARSARAVAYSKPVQDFFFYFLFGVHGVETIWFALTKLKRHSVKLFSPVWLQWTATVFLGGVLGLKHWGEFVKEKEIKAIKEI